jgi:hypothetical protein
MKTKVSKTTNILLRVLIMLLTLGFVYRQLLVRIDWNQWQQLFADTMSNPANIWLLGLVILLFPLNIFTESLKWKKLIDPLEKVKTNKAYTAVLTGIAVSMFLPNRVGDYLGRVFVLEKASHVKGILVTIIGSMAQWLVFFLCGGMAAIKLLPVFVDVAAPYGDLYYIAATLFLISVMLILIWLYYHVGLLKQLVLLIVPKKAAAVERYATVFGLYSHRELTVVLLYSFLRYFIFTLQFFLMLYVLGLKIPYWDAIAALALVYLAITIIPTIAITELGVRGSVAVGLFVLFFENEPFWNTQSAMAVITASTVVWLVNVAIPALLGALLVYRLKFIREDD